MLKGLAGVQGVLYTHIDGRKVDVTHMHIKEWLDCIRNGGGTSCSVERGFEETVTFGMANLSYQEKRRVSLDDILLPG